MIESLAIATIWTLETLATWTRHMNPTQLIQISSYSICQVNFPPAMHWYSLLKRHIFDRVIESTSAGASEKRFLSVLYQSCIPRQYLRNQCAPWSPLNHSRAAWAPFPLILYRQSLQQGIIHGVRSLQLLCQALGIFGDHLACCDLGFVGTLDSASDFDALLLARSKVSSGPAAFTCSGHTVPAHSNSSTSFPGWYVLGAAPVWTVQFVRVLEFNDSVLVASGNFKPPCVAVIQFCYLLSTTLRWQWGFSLGKQLKHLCDTVLAIYVGTRDSSHLWQLELDQARYTFETCLGLVLLWICLTLILLLYQIGPCVLSNCVLRWISISRNPGAGAEDFWDTTFDGSEHLWIRCGPISHFVLCAVAILTWDFAFLRSYFRGARRWRDTDMPYRWMLAPCCNLQLLVPLEG